MLYSLPDELLVVIVEHCDQITRKNLSFVSRRLRNPSQCIIFKTVHVSSSTLETIVADEDGGRLLEVFQNNRLLSYIQTFIIDPGIAYHHLGTGIMVSIFTALHHMQPLGDIRLHSIPFTTTMLDRLCEVLYTQLCSVKLSCCSYPTDYTIQQAALKIHRLELRLVLPWQDGASPHTTIKALVAITTRSLSNIASLTLSSGLDVLAYLGTMPRLTSLNIKLKSDSNDEGLRNFLVANPQLVEFTLDGSFYDLSLLPPSALPNLRTIGVYSAEMIMHLVLGHSAAKVEIYESSEVNLMVDGLRALSRSAAPIVELTLHLHQYWTHLYQILDIVVKAVPRLERISLSFHAEVRSILYQDAILASIDRFFLAVANSPHSSCQTGFAARGQFMGSRRFQAKG